ncbi:hypothetical protein Taro_041124 [Colocasia esculenta]|uniref:RNase H type-1 domain-containing protein n=1 Tax=Colocasia esculenta TaxID=4460 RepID=A0A843WZV3_COLES|nr:hypothetical protein [Colocasia esculenta]
MNSTHVLSKVRLNVQDAISASLLVCKGLPSAQIRFLSQWGIHIRKSPDLIPKVIRWFLPPTGRLKLNVDGAFKSSMGIAGGGGVLRNDRGDIIFCFAHRYPHVRSSLEAEALALRDGIYLCSNHENAYSQDSDVDDVLSKLQKILKKKKKNGSRRI